MERSSDPWRYGYVPDLCRPQMEEFNPCYLPNTNQWIDAIITNQGLPIRFIC